MVIKKKLTETLKLSNQPFILVHYASKDNVFTLFSKTQPRNMSICFCKTFIFNCCLKIIYLVCIYYKIFLISKKLNFIYV